ncbi:sensor histidine kinase [Paraglaciecola marina]|uniref:sensor histidine kinase n=1 Tax=Paraglaciecola marina TaxID=2500157 RepID=UPI00105D8278|nr:sensor histidine kinase [Paraglaciecola marina]
MEVHNNKKHLFDNSLSTWLLIAVLVLGLIIGNAYIAIKTVGELSNTQKDLYQTSESVLALNDLHISVLSAETGQRGYLLTEIDEYLMPYRRALRKVADQMELVKQQHFQHPQQKEHITTLLALSEEKLDELEKTVKLALADKERRALSLVMTGRGRDLYTDILSLINELKEAEIEYRDSRLKYLFNIRQEANITFWLSGITSSLLLFGMLFMAKLNINFESKLRRSLEQQNEKLAEQVAARTKELTIYSEELSRSNRELEDFAFVASHDLQEPLRKIRAFGDRLMSTYEQELEGKGVDYIKRMKTAAERMSNLINDLLDFSRITTRGKDFKSVDLNLVMEDILSDLEIASEESGSQITIDTLPTIQGDKGQMYQLFLNLLSNAIKFRKPEVAPDISITYKEKHLSDEHTNLEIEWHILTITDNGIGFEQEFADKIFVPFQRLHGRSEYKGTGIGLAVCRRIVERHGGNISATSTLGVGTVFTVKIPATPVLFENTESNND